MLPAKCPQMSQKHSQHTRAHDECMFNNSIAAEHLASSNYTQFDKHFECSTLVIDASEVSAQMYYLPLERQSEPVMGKGSDWEKEMVFRAQEPASAAMASTPKVQKALCIVTTPASI